MLPFLLGRFLRWLSLSGLFLRRRLRLRGVIAECISDRDSDAKNIVGVELEVIGHEIPVSFGAHEYIAPCHVLDSDSGVKREMSAVQESTASAGRDPANIARGVKQKSFPAEAGHEVSPSLVRQSGSVNGVEVVHDGPVLLKVVVIGVVIAECTFGQEAEMSLANVLRAGTGIDAALERRRDEPNRRGWIFRRPQRVPANRKVKCLSLRKSGRGENCADESERKGPSQSSPPVSLIGIYGNQSERTVTGDEVMRPPVTN